VRVDLRVISATHRDLEQMVARGQFRADLLARLAGFTVRLPPLVERREDLGMLSTQLLQQAVGDRTPPRLTNEAARALFMYRWPLNVRELEQALSAAVALADEAIELTHLPQAVRTMLRRHAPTAVAPAQPRVARKPKFARDALVDLLARHRGNISAVARELGRDRVQIRRWIRYYQLDPSHFQR
jgi:DNA-binding NtrC family response regulator